MNFLAHLFLSGNDDELLVGNFIADFVKGDRKNDYPDRIRKGIELHRSIDDFTDRHPDTSASKRRLYDRHHHYAGVVVDLYYDHFLAKNFSFYSDIPLKVFAEYSYSTLQSYNHILPKQVIEFLPYMIERNWLVNYASLEGINRTLKGLGQRVKFENRIGESGEDLVKHYTEFESDFSRFFPKLITFAAGKR